MTPDFLSPRLTIPDLPRLFVGFACLGFLWAGCAAETGAGSTDGPPPLEVTRGAFEERYLLTGELVAEEAVELTTPNARIWPVPIRRLVEDGTFVSAGETVVEFDNSQISSNLESLLSQATEARNRLASLGSEIADEIGQAAFTVEQRKADLEKAEIHASVPPNLTSKQEFERRLLAVEKARLELQAAENALAAAREAGERKLAGQRLAVDQAESSARRAQENIELLTLRAPRDGIVLLATDPRAGRPYQEGDSAFPGLLVASLPDLTSLKVEALLFDVDDEKVRPGRPATATLDAFPDEEIPGRILEVDRFADQVDPRSTRRAFKVRVALDEVDPERMRPGMSVKVEVRVPGGERLLIPRAALVLEPDGSKAITAGGKRVPVQLGPCNPEVCVLEGGLEEGTSLDRAHGGGLR